MKNKLKFFEAMRSIAIIAVVAMIVFSMISCDEDSSGGGGGFTVNSTSGSVTISGFAPEYYGKWVYGHGYRQVAPPYEDGDYSEYYYEAFLLAASAVSSNEIITCGQISNSGTVILKVWEYTDYDKNTGKLTLGDCSVSGDVFFRFIICNTANISENNYEFAKMEDHWVDVTFSNGIGSLTVGTFYEDFGAEDFDFDFD